ncbi:MAG: dihydrofolate reductase [Arcobacter sp.]|nr:MAG: dihydrofolate reductase [Arcobacter sp.]
MKCSIFIAPSADGYIADEQGGLKYLETSLKTLSKKEEESELTKHFNSSFANYIKTVDCMIMGRKLMEVLSRFDLSEEDWPYKNIKIIVLSKHLKTLPDNLKKRVEIYRGSIINLIDNLEKEGFLHAYIDGGKTITSFLNEKLINEITITQAPILLGAGVALFGKIKDEIFLENAQATVFPNNFIEIKYTLKYK